MARAMSEAKKRTMVDKVESLLNLDNNVSRALPLERLM